MTKLFEHNTNFPVLRWAEGFVVGLMLMIIYIGVMPKQIEKVPVVEVVEKPVIIKQPVYLNKHDKKQIQCLAHNAYFEARNQHHTGKVAVTNVVMNRVQDKRFPNTPCGVIYQKTGKVCQFSWVCEGNKIVRDRKQFREAVKAAEDVYLENIGDLTAGAKFYHANYVNPRWKYRRVAMIGDHIFYRG
jgi:spore germination cell wall hydrolase CwlJ-like protein